METERIQLAISSDEGKPAVTKWTTKRKAIVFSIAGVVSTVAVVAVSVTVFMTFPRSLPRSIHGNHIVEHLRDVLAPIGSRHWSGHTAALDAFSEILFQRAPSLSQSRQCFRFIRYSPTSSEPTVSVKFPRSDLFVELSFGVDFFDVQESFTLSQTTAAIFPVKGSSGCSDSDFPVNGTLGSFALVLDSGNCSFSSKVDRAHRSGAVGVIVHTDGKDFAWHYSNPAFPIPVITVSSALGSAMRDLAPVLARVEIPKNVTNVTVCNLIAETKSGRNDSVVIIGAHLDSVQDGPGINDNGSGSAAVLEIAIRTESTMLAKRTENRLRFAWWAAEEDNLWGSFHYLRSLGVSGRAEIAAHINLDMVGSPNFVFFISDNGTCPEMIRHGCAILQQDLEEYFTDMGEEILTVDMSAGSDDWNFLQAGIPAISLYSGSRELKTEEQRKVFGGLANAELDPCYHQRCDGIENISPGCIEVNGSFFPSRPVRPRISHLHIKNSKSCCNCIRETGEDEEPQRNPSF